MHSTTKTRLFKILFCLVSISIGVYLILYSLNENIIFFYYPSEVTKINSTRFVKIGGLVKQGSITHIDQTQTKFILTDSKNDIEIYYQGILPLLFREGQGIIAFGQLKNNVLEATELLTKHDEKYKPPT